MRRSLRKWFLAVQELSLRESAASGREVCLIEGSRDRACQTPPRMDSELGNTPLETLDLRDVTSRIPQMPEDEHYP
jgi:hypothetical protein